MRDAILILVTIALAACSTGGAGLELVDGGPDAAADTDVDADADSDTDTDGDTDTGDDPAAPLFDDVGMYEITIAANGDPADVYYPNPPDLVDGGYEFPIALLLQGAEVGKQHYSSLATLVASHGFCVVVPDHESLGGLELGLYAQQSEIAEALAQLVAENGDPDAPVHDALDTDTLVLLGHSYGGVCGLNAIRGVCEPPFCIGLGYDRPPALKGGAFWGTNVALPFIGTLVNTIGNDGLPVALLQGTVDSMALPADTQEAYTKIQDPPKAYVGVIGANHYGACDENNPPGADPDDNPPEIDQAVAVETIGRWSAMFLRAHVLDDGDAGEYVHETGGPSDPNVNVVSEP